MRLDIFSTHPLHPEVTQALAALGDYRVASAPTPEAIVAESRGAEVIVVRAPIPDDVVRREARLRALVRHGAGLDMIPVEAATKAGVLVANVPGANAVTVAEHVIWSAMALLRLYPQVDRDLRGLGWQAGRAHSDHGREISGRVLGIVGHGQCGPGAGTDGRRRLRDARADPHAPAGIGARGGGGAAARRNAGGGGRGGALLPADGGDARADRCGRDRRDEAGGGTGQRRAGARRWWRRRSIEALESGHLGGAALDVFDTQPLPGGHPFFALPNVILTPHMAGITEESMLRMGQGVVAEVERIARGEMPKNFVNPKSKRSTARGSGTRFSFLHVRRSKNRSGDCQILAGLPVEGQNAFRSSSRTGSPRRG